MKAIVKKGADADRAREDILVDSGWLFQTGDPKGAEEVGFNTADWQTVSIPHNWGWEAAQKGDKKYYRGPGWYRRELDVTPEEGKRYFIKFEAAGLVADVYLNGQHLGQHRGGFGAFCYELTGHLAKDGKNLLAVRVSNKQEPDIAPLGGDFNQYGGLYRPVHLITASDVGFTLTDHASPGVVWKQTEVSKEKAILDVTAQVDNGTEEGLPFTHFPKELGQILPEGLYTYVAKVLDAGGNPVVSEEVDINVSPHLVAPFTLRLEIPTPHLWHGTIDPYLYRAIVELRKDGVLVDSVEQPLGLRFFHVDPDKGFFLNGEPYRIRGVSKHQDRQDQGWAVSDADLEEDLALITEMGANAVRCAHYQHSEYWMKLCDQAGLLVWAEIPQVGTIKNTFEFVTTSRNQLLDLIRQNINHPCVFTWGLFNEVHTEHEDPHRQFQDLKILANGEDPTRPVTGATSHAAAPQMNKIPDILGWNRYPGWYDPLSDLENPQQWDKYQPTSRHGGFCFSEYGAGASIEHHEQNPKQPVPAGFWHPEEWQAIVHEAAWKRISATPYLWGSFVWNMFDFCAVKRKEGGKIAINDKGMVTFDRKTRKDAFFFYKANWSDTPVLHLTSKRHTVRNQSETPVKVYCNQGKVTLTVNGKTIGTLQPDDYKVAVWEGVNLVDGENRVAVTAGDLRDEVVWTYDPTAKSMKPAEDDAKRIRGDGGFGQ